MFCLLILIYFYNCLNISLSQGVQTINVLFVNEYGNTVAEKSIEVALNYLRKNPRYGINVEIIKIKSSDSDPQEFLNALCLKYNTSLKENKPPHFVLDTTLTGVISEAEVLYFKHTIK
uniref:Uncharacterized protein n=1 Tax=Clastoptera arizonana TaxID=38151 RepID=A0A1B6C9G0_9HEMI